MIYEALMRSCSIEITGQDLEPEKVTRLIGVNATRARRRGDVAPPSTVPAFQGSWVIDSEQDVGAGPIEDHIAWAASFVRHHQSELIDFRASGLTVCARLFWELGDDVLSASILSSDLVAIANSVERIDLSIV